MRTWQSTAAAGLRLSAVAVASLLASGAQALEFDTGNPDLNIRWDNTVKYSAARRLSDRSPGLSRTAFGPTGVVGANNINQDDGNNNFDKGLVSSRVDVLSELDVKYNSVGARVSAAAWYDQVYNRATDNRTATANQAHASQFATETRDVMGRQAELLDAFVYGNTELDGRRLSGRLGRHTLLWGESLFFGANGIAGGMAPLDLVKLQSVPSSQFKEIARPTGKLSGSYQLSDTVTLGGYVGYEWEKTRLMPSGAYLSGSDPLGPGGQSINAGPTGTFQRKPDLRASDSGQYGLQLRWNAEDIDTQFGLYAIRFHATGPSNIWTSLNGRPPALTANSYQWVYHEGTRAYGVSAAKTIDEWSLAGEVSFRQNMPLSSSGQSIIPAIGVGTAYNNTSNPGYAVGDTAHAQFSWIASLGPSVIAREASFVGEVAWNTRLKTTKNEARLNPNADKSAAAVRMAYTPTYRQLFPGIDVSPSIGVGYTWGKSSAVGPAFGVDKGGDINIGVTLVYLGNWVATLNYVKFLGPEGPTLDNNSNAQFKQALKDRDFVSFSLRTTF
ncbi:DUF1302 domain-containing protein [Hydrogenophaga sp. OTU3427]|uniref:DUF1302 domain-containing protein n=1 Tax=Hydrogenophaga sp. OTU3427 TaxID=3043856 RepID=UPI00313DDA3F